MSRGSRRRSCPWKPLSSISSSASRRRFLTCRLLQPTAGHARRMGRETAAGSAHLSTDGAGATRGSASALLSCCGPLCLGRVQSMIIQRTRGKLPPGTWDKYEQTEQDIVVGKREALTGLRGRWLAPDVKERVAGWPWHRVTVMEANREWDSRLPGVMIGSG